MSDASDTPMSYSADGPPPHFGADGRHSWWHCDSLEIGEKSAIFAVEIRANPCYTHTHTHTHKHTHIYIYIYIYMYIYMYMYMYIYIYIYVYRYI